MGDAISCNLQRSRHDAPIDMTYAAVVAAFTGPSVLIEKWPQAVILLLKKAGSDSKVPFNTLARPRDLDTRRRAATSMAGMACKEQ